MNTFRIIDQSDFIPDISIAMLAYNHENFIVDALESVLMQKTSYTYKIIIAEDCSTDRTREILLDYQRRYPNKIKLILQNKNVGAYKNNINLLTNLEGKYIAALEGDDYWTDDNKLQKQADFLEANKDYSICWTKYLVKNENEKSSNLEQPGWVNQVEQNKDLTFDLNTIFTPYCTYTLTAMFRVKGFDFKMLNDLNYVKDNTLYAICLTQGKGILLNFTSAVYRVHDGGIYSKVSVFKQRYYSYLNMKEIIDKIPGCDNENLRYIRDFLFYKSVKYYPSQFDKEYWHLISNSYKFYGIKKTLKFIKSRYK
jgi:glycosyltransferase involved in cell wall biosynthesis